MIYRTESVVHLDGGLTRYFRITWRFLGIPVLIWETRVK